MDRRDTVIALLALGAAPAAAFAQASTAHRRVAVVFNGSVDAHRSSFEALQQGLHRLGYKEGANLQLDVAYGDGLAERVATLIREAVARKPAVIVTHGSAIGIAVKKETSTIPVVMAQMGDPVAIGLAASLGRPGGNFTGNIILDSSFLSKSLEILHETFPAMRTFGVLSESVTPTTHTWSALEATAKNLKVSLERFNVSSSQDIDRSLAEVRKKRPGALLVLSQPLFSAHRKRMIESLMRDRIPQIWPIVDAADLGALMSHGAAAEEMWRNAANFVHRILQGAKPGDLPFEQATRFEFRINLKAAKALAIKIPQSVLLRADRVVE